MRVHSALRIPHSALKWLPDMDLNHDKQIQSLLCYRYTIGQSRFLKVGNSPGESSRAEQLDDWIIGLVDYCPEGARRLLASPLIHHSINPLIQSA